MIVITLCIAHVNMGEPVREFSYRRFVHIACRGEAPGRTFVLCPKIVQHPKGIKSKVMPVSVFAREYMVLLARAPVLFRRLPRLDEVFQILANIVDEIIQPGSAATHDKRQLKYFFIQGIPKIILIL